jgi:DNA-directed RNA polymerase subunit M/transcription elongation factor TFIIS
MKHDYKEMDSHTEEDEKTGDMVRTVFYKCTKCGHETETVDGVESEEGE